MLLLCLQDKFEGYAPTSPLQLLGSPAFILSMPHHLPHNYRPTEKPLFTTLLLRDQLEKSTEHFFGVNCSLTSPTWQESNAEH